MVILIIPLTFSGWTHARFQASKDRSVMGMIKRMEDSYQTFFCGEKDQDMDTVIGKFFKRSFCGDDDHHPGYSFSISDLLSFFETVDIPPGSFQRGNPNEKQFIHVSRSFEIMTKEVTQFQWFLIMGDNPSHFSKKKYCRDTYMEISTARGKVSLCPHHPVEMVSWNDSQRFINRLNKLVGCDDGVLIDMNNIVWEWTHDPYKGKALSENVSIKDLQQKRRVETSRYGESYGEPHVSSSDFYLPLEPLEETSQEPATARDGTSLPKTLICFRLPMEAEWELSARAGTDTDYYFGNFSFLFKVVDHAWFGQNSDNQTHIVGQKESNNNGLFDVYGNVAEWVHDKKDDSFSMEIHGRLKNEDFNSVRVIRGGDWGSSLKKVHSGFRSAKPSHSKGNNIGLRLVKTVTRKTY